MAEKTLNPDRNPNQNTVRKIPDVPPEVIQEILSRLPLDSLIRSAFVCKDWEALFVCRQTRLMHYKQSSQNPKPTNIILFSFHEKKFTLHYIPDLDLNSPRIKKEAICLKTFETDRNINFSFVGSCNGFVCFVAFDCSVFFCNPFIGKVFRVPSPNKYAIGSLFGFGYNPKKNEYKFIQKGGDNIDVITVGGNSWRTIDVSLLTRLMDDKVNFTMDIFSKAFVNGRLHWLHFGGGGKVADIISWDVDTEEFGRISVPDAVKGTYGDNSQLIRPIFTSHLAVMRGCLSVVVNFREENLAVVWVMNKYGNEGSWAAEFVIPRPWKGKMVHVLGMHNDKNIVLQCDGKGLYSYDPEKKKKKFRVSGLPKKFNSYFHVGTIVGLSDVILLESS